MNWFIRIHMVLYTVLCAAAVFGQTPAPGIPAKGSTLVLNATVHTGTGEVVKNAVLVFEDGKFTKLVEARKVKVDKNEYDHVIDGTGKHVYPGIIAPNSTLGLTEIGAVRATHDYAEVGTFTPEARAIIAYNTESKVTMTVRSNGVLLAQVTPRSGIVSGSSSVVQLDAWNWEDAAVKIDDGMHIYWPRKFSGGGWWAEPKPKKENKAYEEQIHKIRELFDKAKAYAGDKKQERINVKYEPLKGIFEGTKTLYIHANFVKDLLAAIHFIKSYDIAKSCIVGGYDADMVTDLLKENNIAVMVQRTHSLPLRPEDDIYKPYKLPVMLVKAGVLTALENSGDMEAMNARNIPFLAGTAAAYGLTEEEALKLITLNTAIILGIDKDYGSIEIGKNATFFISDGDALDMTSNNVIYAFINGRSVDLTNHQKALYEKYKIKFGY